MKHGNSTSELLLRRDRLLERCAAQRDDLAVLAQRLDGPLRLADRGIAGVRYVRAHPLALGAVVGLAAVMGRRRLWKWAQRGFIGWRAYRAFGKLKAKSLF